MSQKTEEVKLTFDELLVLDGKCRPEIQLVVDMAKTAIDISSTLPEPEAMMIAKIVNCAKQKKALTFQPVSIDYCPCCGKQAEYMKYNRTTRYHRKGETDYSRRIPITGYDLDRGFVVMRSTIFTGYCYHCKDRVQPVLSQQLADVEAEIPNQITGQPSKYLRYKDMKCKECGWNGSEHLMGKLMTFMGDGSYRGKCPGCGAKNEFLSTKIEPTGGYHLVEAKEQQ